MSRQPTRFPTRPELMSTSPDNAFDASPHAATTDGLTVSPALDLVAEPAQVPVAPTLVDGRVVQIAAVAVGLGVLAAGVAAVFLRLITLITNIAFFQQASPVFHSPSENQLGLWVM